MGLFLLMPSPPISRALFRMRFLLAQFDSRVIIFHIPRGNVVPDEDEKEVHSEPAAAIKSFLINT